MTDREAYQSAEGLRVSREGRALRRSRRKKARPRVVRWGLLPSEVSPRDAFLILALDAVQDLDSNILENCPPR